MLGSRRDRLGALPSPARASVTLRTRLREFDSSTYDSERVSSRLRGSARIDLRLGNIVATRCRPAEGIAPCLPHLGTVPKIAPITNACGGFDEETLHQSLPKRLLWAQS